MRDRPNCSGDQGAAVGGWMVAVSEKTGREDEIR